MFILDINKSIIKTIIVYFGVTIFTLIFDKVYFIFSHGVSSAYMDLMFLYPLIGGAFTYIMILIFFTNINYKEYRIPFNIYNSGISVLTVGSLLHGILEIAGTSSIYIRYFSIIGWGLVAIGIISLFLIKFNRRLFLDKK
ncbi:MULTISPECIES: hypothetical protein [unclassified Clostridium]|uniref:hypothetical protein n=1 Tax=unclassified Clostridium TaxID=2614128 RepID=UPI0025BCDFE8|nr:hypothetical protein [Clostridium sp.]MDY4253650.1 hypothetical protein [Clostridium sp.]